MPDDFLKSLTPPEEKPESYQPESFVLVKRKPFNIRWFAIPGIVIIGGLVWFLNQPKLIVPDMTGWTLTDAATWAQRYDVQLVLDGQYATDPADIVLVQALASGTSMSLGDVLELTVSLGPDPMEVLDLEALRALTTKTDVIAWLDEHAVENFTFVTVIDDACVPGTVVDIALDPEDGEWLRSDSVVITISTQSEPVILTVLDFSSISADAAEAWGDDNGVDVVIRRSFSYLVAKEKLISQSLSEGSTLSQDTSLVLEYSAGAPVKIPDFSSMTPEAAKTWASSENIALTVESRYSSLPSQTMISQSLKSGSTVETQTKLTVVYSLGGEVNVGNYVNQSLLQLRSTIEGLNAQGANLSLSITEQYSTSVSVNRIIAVSVSDASVPIGSTLDVVVSLGSLVEVPDFTLSVKSNWVETYNALLSSAKAANATIRISVTDDPDSETIQVTQSLDPGVITSSAVLIDVTITY